MLAAKRLSGIRACGPSADRVALVRALVAKVELGGNSICIIAIGTALLETLSALSDASRCEHETPLTADAMRVRRGHEVRLVIPGDQPAPKPQCERNEEFVALLAEAAAVKTLVLGKLGQPLSRIAAEAGRCRSRLGRLFALSHLAPDIIGKVIDGRQPSTLSAKRLLALQLPLDWHEQRAALGLA